MRTKCGDLDHLNIWLNSHAEAIPWSPIPITQMIKWSELAKALPSCNRGISRVVAGCLEARCTKPRTDDEILLRCDEIHVYAARA